MTKLIRTETRVSTTTAKLQMHPKLCACEVARSDIAAVNATTTTKTRARPSHNGEVGIGLALLHQIQKKYRGNPIKQACEFSFHFSAVTGNQSLASNAAQSTFRADLIEIVHVLRGMNMRIQNLSEISSKQMRLMILYMEKQGTPIVKLALLRRTIRNFGIWAGKPQLCPAPTSQVAKAADAVPHGKV